MTTQTKLVIPALSTGLVVLAIALFVSIANGDGHHDDQDDSYMGMMDAIADMDTTDMLTHMREIMGDEGFAKMEAHMTDHQSMPMTGNEDADRMMHQIMDGMMDHMMDGDTGSSDRHGDHHPTVAPAS